ncbi:MAG: hypothetical protein ABI211_08650 [Vicinamibacterales bacterium]
MSNAAQGQHWKARTKKWLEEQGYQVGHLEIQRVVHTPRGMFPLKRDQFGSDLLAVGAGGVVFVQVKGGAAPRSQLAVARAAFADFLCPPGAQQWVVLWQPRAREPEVVVVNAGGRPS